MTRDNNFREGTLLIALYDRRTKEILSTLVKTMITSNLCVIEISYDNSDHSVSYILCFLCDGMEMKR